MLTYLLNYGKTRHQSKILDILNPNCTFSLPRSSPSQSPFSRGVEVEVHPQFGPVVRRGEDKNLTGKALMKHVMQNWINAGESLVAMVVTWIKTCDGQWPIESQKYSIAQLPNTHTQIHIESNLQNTSKWYMVLGLNLDPCSGDEVATAKVGTALQGGEPLWRSYGREPAKMLTGGWSGWQNWILSNNVLVFFRKP